MTRGQKGCFVFCTDSALQEYLKRKIGEGYVVSKGEGGVVVFGG